MSVTFQRLCYESGLATVCAGFRLRSRDSLRVNAEVRQREQYRLQSARFQLGMERRSLRGAALGLLLAAAVAHVTCDPPTRRRVTGTQVRRKV